MGIGFKMKKIREIHNLSQEDLAFVLEISQSKLSKIENGRLKKIDYILFNKFCKHFSLRPEELCINFKVICFMICHIN